MKKLFIILFLLIPSLVWGIDIRGKGYETYPGHGTTMRGAYDAPNGIGMICVVTDTTNDSGTLGDSTRNGTSVKTGSLLECIDANPGENYGKIILFEVSGTIAPSGTNDEYTIDYPYTSIYGQTAPYPGIELKNVWLRVSSASNVFIQHIRVRNTDDYDTGVDADYLNSFETAGTFSNLVVDHCSFQWSPDTVFSIGCDSGTCSNQSVSYSIIAEGIAASLHTESPHSKAFYLADAGGESENVSIIGNFIAHGADRMPLLNGDAQFLNNITYNHGTVGYAPLYFYTDAGITGEWDIVGNYSKMGSDSGSVQHSIELRKVTQNACSDYDVYISDNVCYAYGDNDYSAPDPGWGACVDDSAYSCEGDAKSLTALNLPSGYTPYSSLTVPAILTATSGLRSAGAWPAHRDAVDTCQLAQFSASSGTCGSTGNELGCIPDDESENCGDGWSGEAENNHTLQIPTSPHTTLSSGYTRLEEWIMEGDGTTWGTEYAEGREIETYLDTSTADQGVTFTGVQR